MRDTGHNHDRNRSRNNKDKVNIIISSSSNTITTIIPEHNNTTNEGRVCIGGEEVEGEQRRIDVEGTKRESFYKNHVLVEKVLAPMSVGKNLDFGNVKSRNWMGYWLDGRGYDTFTL